MSNKPIKSILDEDLQEGETERQFTRYKSDAGKFKHAEAFQKAEAKKKAETLPVPAQSENSGPLSFPDLFFLGKKVKVHSPRKGEYWFCLSDVCEVLGYKSAEQTRKTCLLGEAMKYKPEKSPKEFYYISESDLYNLLLRSSKPVAVPFRKWVTEKVLPSLRENRKYMMTEEVDKRLEQKFSEMPSSQGIQLEMFPITAKPSLAFQPAAVDKLETARKKLLESNTAFNTYSDFLGYLIRIGLEQIGITGFEFGKDAK